MVEFSFRQFLIESATIGQFLRGIIKPETRDSFIKTKQLLDEKLKEYNFPPKIHQLMINYILVHQLMLDKNAFHLTFKTNQFDADMNAVLANKSIANVVTIGFLNHLRQWKDFLIARQNDAKLLGQLNNIDFSPEMLDQESKEWHDELALRAKGPGPEGRTILELSHIGWKGWKWISLDRGYCKREGDAAGHCGNAAVKAGDNILSLRDPQNFVRLTFIVNNGVLGESKGRGNDKPSPKYHPAIIELLKSPFVQTIRGGGYAPENNFELEDLSPEQQQEIKRFKPEIDYFDHVIKSNDPKLFGDLLNTEIKRIENGELVVDEFETWFDLYAAIRSRNVKDFSWLDDPIEMFDNAEAPDVKYLIDDLDQENMIVVKKLLAIYIKENPNEDHEDHDEDEIDLKHDIDKYEELKDAISQAGRDGVIYGAEAEAYKDAQKQLSSVTDNGFWIDFKHHPYTLRTNTNNIRSIWKDANSREEVERNGLSTLYDFDYSPPYNGYSDFDKETFNERLKELFGDLEPSDS